MPLWAAGAVLVFGALVALNVWWLTLLVRIATRRVRRGPGSASGIQEQPSMKLDQPPPSLTTMGSSVTGGALHGRTPRNPTKTVGQLRTAGHIMRRATKDVKEVGRLQAHHWGGQSSAAWDAAGTSTLQPCVDARPATTASVPPM